MASFEHERRSQQAASEYGKKFSSRNHAEQRFQSGLFAYFAGDYSRALGEFEIACETASQRSDHERFVEICSYILRILAEREEFKKIERIEARVLAIAGSVTLQSRVHSRIHYVLGICNCYQDSKHDQAMDRFRQAIDLAVSAGEKSALASPLYGAATVLYARGRFDEALKQLNRLEILLSCLHLPDLISASYLLRSMILRNRAIIEYPHHLPTASSERKKASSCETGPLPAKARRESNNALRDSGSDFAAAIDESLNVAWKAFDSLKHNPNLVLYLNTLCVLGSLFTLKQDFFRPVSTWI